MSTVEAEPKAVVFAAIAAINIVITERDAAMHVWFDIISHFAVPPMAGLDLDVSAAESHSVVRDDPFVASVCAATQHSFGMFDRHSQTHWILLLTLVWAQAVT